MDDLIYQFLLRAGYPRASIISDPTLLAPWQDRAAPEDATTFVIVDPETAERLAAIEVVEAIGADALREVAARVASYARRLGGRDVQGFVIRIDPNGRSDAEQVQFYRVWPNPLTQQLSAKTFPDLDALRVARRLAREAMPRAPEIIDVAPDEDEERAPERRRGLGFGGYLPAFLLLALALIDWLSLQLRGTALLTPAQSLLAIGAAALLTVAAIVRALRD